MKTRHVRTTAARSVRPCLRAALAAGLILCGAAAASAQTPAAPPKPPRVFLHGPGFEPQALQAEIPFVDFVDDPGRAQVEVSIEPRPEGTVIRFAGRAEFEKNDSTRICRAEPGEPPEAQRNRIIQTIKLGLLRYASKTGVAGRLGIRLLDAVKPTAVVDPWNFWVFSAGVDAFLNGEDTYKSQMWMGNFSANRVTPQWKIRLALNGNYQLDKYNVEDIDYASESRGEDFSGLVVRSLGEHWSVGAQFQVSSSTFSNTRWSVQVRPAVEYDVFPYSESTKKQLRFLYAVGPTYIRYREETIYDKTRESLLAQSLTAALDLKQPWGSIGLSLAGSHYFHDVTKYRVDLNAQLSIRLFQGFNFNIMGSGSRIHDQLSLPKGGATYEEVLLRRKQLETGFQYYFSAGFSYSFGSIFSNIINPRFGSGDGGMSMHISM